MGSDRTLKIANVCAFLAVLLTNFLVYCRHGGNDDNDNGGGTKPPPHGEPGPKHTGADQDDDGCNTLLTPAMYTFLIWVLIYALQCGFVIYQWFAGAHDAVTDAIKWHYVAASALNICWILAWTNEKLVILNAFLLVGSTLVLGRIYCNLRNYPAQNVFDELFIHWTFTIYGTWAYIATVINFWIAFHGLDTPLLSSIAIVCIGLTTLHCVDYSHRKDVICGLTTIWVLVGIIVRHTDVTAVVVSSSFMVGAIGSAIVRIVYIKIVDLFSRTRYGNSGERNPLLSA